MVDTSTPVIEATGLKKRFGSTQALDGIDLRAEQGRVLGVLGPNGAGKTTAVRILSTLIRPDAGSARVGGHDVVADPTAVRRLVGLTGQYASLDEDLSGTQNLVMIGQLLNLSGRQAKARAKELLAWFDLTEAANKPSKTYSGGMRRRLDLAASLVGRPAVIVLDEPTTGLDPAKREDMWDVIRGLVGQGSTVLLTTQYLDEADALADEISVIDRGRVIASDTPDGLKRVIGGQRITVRPSDPERVGDVRRILQAISDVEPEPAGRDTWSVPVDSDAALALTVGELSRQQIAVTEVSLHLPSLDEVFMTLTGKSAESADQQAHQPEQHTEKEVAA